MTLRERVARLYLIYPQPRSFEEDEAAYRLSGHVIETPEVFVLGKAVSYMAPAEEILDPHVAFARRYHDAWFIHAMAGNLRAMHKVMPYHLPMIGWARRGGELRWHWLEDAHHLIDVLVPNPQQYSILTRRA